MKILAHDPMPPQNMPTGVQMVDLDTIFRTGNVHIYAHN
jgi:hypothetical protein